jgi:hypothetical protein
MSRTIYRYLNIIACLVLIQTTIIAQEIPVAVGKDNTSIGGGADDGTNYLLTIVGDSLGGKFPTGGVGGFMNGHYILGATRIDPQFLDGDVYIKSIAPLVTGIDIKGDNGLPSKFVLSQNFPNPFNPSTVISYSVPKTSLVTIKVYNILGKEVTTLVNEQKSAGNYSVQFYGSKLSSGIYFYRMQAGSFVQTKKLLLLK